VRKKERERGKDIRIRIPVYRVYREIWRGR